MLHDGENWELPAGISIYNAGTDFLTDDTIISAFLEMYVLGKTNVSRSSEHLENESLRHQMEHRVTVMAS